MSASLDDTSVFQAWEIERMCGIQRRNFALLVRAWGGCHRQLLLLNLCERTAFFVTHDLPMNEAFLGVLRGSELHECALRVVRLQRRMVRYEQRMNAAVAEETRLNDEHRLLIE